MNTSDVHTLVGAYVLDAVDDLERAAVERHLAGCAECATEVAELRATAARLGSAVAAPPPPGLRERVLAEARRTRQLAPAARPVEPASSPDVVRRWRAWTAAAVAAAVIAVGVGTTTYVVQENRVSTERQQAADIRAVLSAPDARVILADVTGGGRVSVIKSDQRGEAVVVMTDLPEVDRQKAYQLWTIVGSQATASNVMAGGQRSGVTLLKGLSSVDALGLTREPAGGSKEPTKPVLAAVPIRR
ncbi:anti-sigma factor [Longispora sp. K20-0274]|uniref:anti-sigma factor n=1 Tax=Longispora sp. K20-0274 TaxID=3088255 RepID=UPI00399A2619